MAQAPWLVLAVEEEVEVFSQEVREHQIYDLRVGFREGKVKAIRRFR